MHRHTVLIGAVVLALIVVSCGRSEAEADAEENWTIEREGVQLEEDLFLTETDEFFFGWIADLDVAEDGRIYVADGGAHHVKVLSPEGELLETIGRKGEGPGEFERPSEIVIARGDSLYVLDRSRGRISVFTPEHHFAYSFAVRIEQGSPSRMMVPKKQSGYIFIYFSSMFPVDEEQGKLLVRRVGAREIMDSTLFTTRPPQMHIEQGDDGGIHIHTIPFSRSPHFALGSAGNVHYAWNDSLRVTSYDGTGRRLRTVDVPFEAVPVTAVDRERVLQDRPEESRSVVRDQIPNTRPAFDHFLIDDRDRYWFKRPTDDRERSDWWIADPEAERVSVVPLPSDVDLREVKDGYAYGRTTTDDGAPALVRYRIQE